jgi:hypothetical protein
MEDRLSGSLHSAIGYPRRRAQACLVLPLFYSSSGSRGLDLGRRRHRRQPQYASSGVWAAVSAGSLFEFGVHWAHGQRIAFDEHCNLHLFLGGRLLTGEHRDPEILVPLQQTAREP